MESQAISKQVRVILRQNIIDNDFDEFSNLFQWMMIFLNNEVVRI